MDLSGETLALLRERAMYLRSGRASRVIAVDDELRKRGIAVDLDGNPVPYVEKKPAAKPARKERADKPRAPERAVED
jgi:hypothetical protein